MMPAERIPLSQLLEMENRALLEMLAGRISRGAVVVYPTETIYGIGGRSDRPEVYNRIITAKKRPPDRHMIVIAASRNSFAHLGISFPPVAETLARTFWPGLLTLILPSAGNADGIAVRVSNHPFLTALAPLFNLPLFSTSANVTGEPYDPDPDTIYSLMRNHVDVFVDAGVLPVSKPSTIVKITVDGTVTVVREGCIPAAEIHAVL